MAEYPVAHLSYSSVALALECARKWRYRYVDKLVSPATSSLVVGSALHGTIQTLLLARHGGESPDPAEVFAEQWRKAAAQDVDWGDGADDARDEALRLTTHPSVLKVIEALEPFVDEAGPVVERRLELRVPGVPIPIIGYLDYLGNDGILRDFKTATRPWTPTQLEEQTQPLVYLAAANQMDLPHVPGAFEHVVFVKARTPQVQVLRSSRPLGASLWLFSVIRGVWQAIAAGADPPNPKACFAWGRRCEFWDRCRGRYG